MGKKKSAADAAASKLGYLYQCRFAMRLALEKGDDPSRAVSLEAIDDVTLHDSTPNSGARSTLSASKAFQLKHKIKRSGGTTNSHTDIWKSLKNWAIAIKRKAVQLEKCDFLLVTTATASDSHAISGLRRDANARDPETARAKLEAAGKKSRNPIVAAAYKELMKLSIRKRKQLFSSIILVEGSSRIDDIRADIEKLVWMAVPKQHANAFVERLEGWWFDCVIEHLIDDTSVAIPLSLVHAKFHDLGDQFRNDNLPDDLIDEDVPAEELDENDERIFVRQLRHIGVGPGRIQRAQENHYKAATQRSRWIRDKMIDLQELDRFELNLIDEWKEFYTAIYDGCDTADDAVLTTHAVKLYEWSQVKAVEAPTLFIRPLFRSRYLTRGSYQMLADQVRVGWHRDYDTLFAEDASDVDP